MQERLPEDLLRIAGFSLGLFLLALAAFGVGLRLMGADERAQIALLRGGELVGLSEADVRARVDLPDFARRYVGYGLGSGPGGRLRYNYTRYSDHEADREGPWFTIRLDDRTCVVEEADFDKREELRRGESEPDSACAPFDPERWRARGPERRAMAARLERERRLDCMDLVELAELLGPPDFERRLFELLFFDGGFGFSGVGFEVHFDADGRVAEVRELRLD